MVSTATGTSDRCAGRIIRIGRAFSEAQLEILERRGVTQRDMEELSRDIYKDSLNDIVEQIGNGAEPNSLIAARLKYYSPEAKEEREASEAQEKVKWERKLSNKDWFDRFCGKKAESLEHPKQYRIAAILFRRTLGEGSSFRSRLKKLLDEAQEEEEEEEEEGGEQVVVDAANPFLSLLKSLLLIGHPMDFPLCDTCTGRGETPFGTCKDCKGCGFTLACDPKL